MLGTIIGEKYRLERSIGTGGMGEVFEARHMVTGRAVAVKLLYEQPAVNEAVASDRFRHEAYAAGTLDAEHIVQVFDAGTDRDTGRRYLVMELLRGESLHTLIKRFGPLAPELAFSIVGQAALGLSKAHAAGIVHRDVKPANIFLSLEADEVVVKVLDFGIAKVRDLDDDPAAMGGQVVGSPHYMSPEQAQDLPTLDHRSDLFSLGAVLYRLLSGQTPHPTADTLVRLMYAICTEPARPLSEVAPWVPPEMVAFVERAIAIPPSARFQSAGEMAHGIATIVGDLRIAPADVGPITEEQRAGFEPSSSRRFDDAGAAPQAGPGVNARSWDQTLQGSVATRPDKGSLLTAVLGAIAMAVVLLAVMGLWRTRGSSVSRAIHAAVTSVTPVASAASAEPAPITPAGMLPQTGTLMSAARSVWVHVPPAEEVLVDGQRTVPSPTGYVEVVGELGSRHEIGLTAAGRLRTTQVVITPDGAFPDAIALGNPAPAERVSAPGERAPSAPKRRVVKREATALDAGHRDGVAAAIVDAAENARIRPAPTPREDPPEDPFGSIKLPTERKTFDD
ncbi:serine/threonine protein kinase [Pendulispora rubella]|uniref:Serine/threonine protein kinase n=1 Tax=Pendulispora rubella TaxID=2741070 RepID=A0ABZ2LI02_9BACT